MAGLISKCGPLFEYLLFHDPYDSTILSDVRFALARLERRAYVWLDYISNLGYFFQIISICLKKLVVKSVALFDINWKLEKFY